MKIYIASPYTRNPEQNTLRVLKVADKLLEWGYIPVVPHLFHYWDLVSPKPWETWIKIGKAFLEDCDILLRLTGESEGADGEVMHAIKKHIPVFFAVDDELIAFKEWLEFRKPYVSSDGTSGKGNKDNIGGK